MRVQADHWAILLDFCEIHPEIITNKFNSINGRSNSNYLWNELTILLNSVGLGEKSQEEWKKTLIDWKSKTKAKAARIQNYKRKTGGGEALTITLTGNEERLLNLMGKTAVQGNVRIPEVGIRKRKLEATDLPEVCQVHTPRDVAEASTSQLCNNSLLNMETTTVHTHANAIVQIHKPVTDMSSPINKSPIVTANNENKNSEEVGSLPSTPSVTHHKATTNRYHKRLDTKSNSMEEFNEMNSKLLDILFEMNGNLQDISESFVKLVSIVENKNINRK